MASFIAGHLAVRVVAVVSCLGAASAVAQDTTTKRAGPGHPPVCATGVRVFTDRSQVPVPFDTLAIPPAAEPIRVSSPEEAEVAELAVRGRAGSVGATGVLFVDVESEDNGVMRLHRSVTAVFAPADSARAQLACKQQ